MLFELYMWFHSKEAGGNSEDGALVMLGACILSFCCGAIAYLGYGPFPEEPSILYAGIVAFSFLWLMVLYGGIILFDMVLEKVVRYITHDERVIEKFILRKLYGPADSSYFFSHDNALAAFLVSGSTLLNVIILLITVKWVWIIGAICGMIFGILYLARRVYGVSMKLRNHVSDTNAHSNQKENLS